MSQKHLSRTLSKLAGFKNPKINLEQYATPSDVAAELLWYLDMRGFIKNKKILDLGAGTGILGIGALLLGAQKVFFLEKDFDALNVLKENISFMDKEYVLPDYEIINKDVSFIDEEFDLVIMNPPFGTKTKRIDSVFLEKAFQISSIILSIHKTSTKDYVKNKFLENNFELLEVFDFNFALKKTFDHHKESVKNIEISGFVAKRR